MRKTHEGQDRRGFLRAAGIAGAGAAALGVSGTAGAGQAAAAVRAASPSRRRPGGWNPDTESAQFTLAVMPDTQFMYWGTQGSINPEPQRASFQYVIENSALADNVIFMAHLGDLTEDADVSSMTSVGQAFDIMDSCGAAYSVLAGNHDVGGTDQRGSTPYLQIMGPQRFKNSPTFAGADATGYNTAHIFRAAGQDWLLLALDWRMSTEGFDWANGFIKANPKLPVILTSHEIVGSVYNDNVYPYQAGDPNNNASFSGYGQQIWDGLINDNDQIFLTLNGHYWPPGRMTQKNSVGDEVHLHGTNYQNRYFGGGAMIRLYHFDLDRNAIDVETVSPWILAQPPQERNVLQAQEAQLTTEVDYFSVQMDFEQRFSKFAPVTRRPGRPPREELVPGTLAYWRFDKGGAIGTPVTASQTIKDWSGNGNDLTTLVTVPGSASNVLTWSNEYHPDQPGHGSLYFDGGQNPLHGAYLTTAANAPLNAETFPNGFTFEVFVKIPLDWNGSNNSWMSVLSRWGEAGQAGKSGQNTDPNEPVMTLSFSGDRETQWNVYPTNLTYPTTNWSHGLPEETWWHVAAVNDGQRTVLYIEGCPVVDNAQLRESVGITTLSLPWALGGYEYGGSINQIFHGYVGDVRIVSRPLSIDEFMIS